MSKISFALWGNKSTETGGNDLLTRISSRVQDQHEFAIYARGITGWNKGMPAKGKHGRGASGRTIVFGIFNRNGKVQTEIVPEASRKTLQDIIKGRVQMKPIIHSDGQRRYTGLVDLGDKNTLESIMGRRSLLEERPILTVLKVSEVMISSVVRR